MSIEYRLKLSKSAIQFKDQGNFTLNKSVNLTEKIKTNFILNYYADPLFTKVSRLNIEKLNNKLKLINNSQTSLDGIEIFKTKLKKKLRSRNLLKNVQLSNIYNYEKEYFKTSGSFKTNQFIGSQALSVKKKSSRTLNTNLRYDTQIVEMVKSHLNYYYTENYSLELNNQTSETKFIMNNENTKQMKQYNQGLKNSEGYLYVHFSKKNLFLTLTDVSGNCIVYLSSGAEGLKRREKQKPFATRLLTNKISKIAKLKNIDNISIIFNPNNRYQRWRIKPIMRTLETFGLTIKRVQRKVVQAHGGCRKKKSRRI
mgnify:CR=1 FL=1